MNRLIQIANNAKALNEKKILFEVYSDDYIQDVIIDLNRIGQLFKKGVDINEEVIGRYSQTTELLNPEKRAGTPYTLKDTGEFYRTFNIKVTKDGSFTINADTIKEDKDLLEYGDILGLTKPSLNELIEEILPFFIEETRKLLLK